MAEALEQLLRSEQLGNEIAKLADEEVSVQMLIEEDFSLTDLSPAVIKLGPAKKLLRLVNQFKDKQQAAAGSAMDLPSNGSAAPPPSEQLEQQQQDVVMEVDSQSNLSQQAEEQSQDLTQTQNNSEMMVDEIAKVDDEDILAQIDKDNEEDNEESLLEESKAEESKAEESKIEEVKAEESKGQEEKEEEDEDLPEKKDEIAEPTAIHSESQAALVLDDISDKEDGEEDEEDEKQESLNECHHRRSPTTANTTELFTVPVSPSGHIQESTGGDRSRSSSSDSGRAAGERRSRSRSRSPRSPRSRSRSHSRASSCSRSSSPHSVEKQPAPRLSPGNSPAQKRNDNLNRRIPTQTYRRSRSRSPHDNRRSRTRSRSRSPRRTTRRLSPPPPPPARRRQTATNLTPTRNNSSNNSNQRRASVTFNTTTNAVRAHNWHSNGVTVCKCCHQDPRGNTCTAICYNYHFRNGCLNTKNCHYLHDLARGQLICVLFTAFPDQLTHITVEVDAPFKRSWSHKEDLSVAVRIPHNLRQRLSSGVYGITEKEYEAGTSFVNLLNIATIKSN